MKNISINNNQVDNLLSVVKEVGNDLIDSITSIRMNEKSLTDKTQLLTYVKVIYDGISDYETIDRESQKTLKDIIEGNISITKEMVIYVIKSNLIKFDQADNDNEVINLFLSGLKSRIIKSSSSYTLSSVFSNGIDKYIRKVISNELGIVPNTQVNANDILSKIHYLPFEELDKMHNYSYLVRYFCDEEIKTKYPEIAKELNDPKYIEHVAYMAWKVLEDEIIDTKSCFMNKVNEYLKNESNKDFNKLKKED